MNDQHAYLETPAHSELKVGDRVGFGIAHPCTTFDRWPVMMMIDDDYRVVDAIRTFF
jgi:D-serine dehydratase